MKDRKIGKNIFGFTLIEVLVAVSIIGILSAVLAVNSLDSGKQSRDIDRQADLRAMQSAIELYKNKYGRYPDGCNGANIWSGQQGTSFACSGNDTQYIVGHVDVNDLDGDGDITERFSFAPEFISVLPIDPKKGNGDYGYVYVTNAAGTVYKLMAMNSVEGGDVNYTHPFRSCDVIPDPDTGGYQAPPAGDLSAGWCINIWDGVNTDQRARCKMEGDGGGSDKRFEKSYGVWGGFAKLSYIGINREKISDITPISNVPKFIAGTTDIICK